ncbi:hypothetical protein AAG906_013680 [Vitis piasezkii]
MLAYKQMDHLTSTLKNPGRLLFRFNGDTTTSLGDVVLPIQADLVTLSMRCLVVDDLSPYNAIMGRAWLHKMKVIPYTYHQMDSFPLPRIDQIVDATAGHGIISFLDAFFGYHQIPMFKPDEEKTRVMPFGLNNAGATYQRLMKKKSSINPTQVKAILETPAPSSKKELQRLTGCLIVLDEASRVSGSRVGLVLQSPSKELVEQAIHLSFSIFNNEVEYEAMLLEAILNQLSSKFNESTKQMMNVWSDTSLWWKNA